MNTTQPQLSALSIAILICSTTAFSATDTNSATTVGDHPAGIFGYAKSTPADGTQVPESRPGNESQTNPNPGGGAVSIISAPDSATSGNKAANRPNDNDQPVRNRPVSAGQSPNGAFSVPGSAPRETTADERLGNSSPRDAMPDASLDSSMPRDADPGSDLQSSMPADANPDASLESSMPADAPPGIDSENSLPADTNPGTGLESSMPANTTPDASVESAQPFSRNTAPLNR